MAVGTEHKKEEARSNPEGGEGNDIITVDEDDNSNLTSSSINPRPRFSSSTFSTDSNQNDSIVTVIENNQDEIIQPSSRLQRSSSRSREVNQINLYQNFLLLKIEN